MRQQKVLPLRALFEAFLADEPDYLWLQEPFRAVVAVCNAAIHAQPVPDNQANEALTVGAKIIATLQDVDPDIQ